ncbi:MAG TPA: hypothetical protein VMG09_00455 [Bacteroidota bacterium]|nr:hypothetical protein [Bacteroidota bacterium]
MPSRILLGQLSCNGDILYATTIARQIKKDFPGCHLTWAVASLYRRVLDGNPFVDEIWEIPARSRAEIEPLWPSFAREAKARKKRGEFDEVFLTQVNPDNYRNFDGTVRASIFRGYPRPITVPVTPVMRLFPDEVERVRELVTRTGFCSGEYRVLFEAASTSNQSFITPKFAHETATLVLQRLPGARFILSSDIPVRSDDPRIIDGSVVRFRENAELTRYSSLLVGCSSGITWLSTSDWATPLPMIQLLRRETSVFASVVHDAEHFGLPTEPILEMTECLPSRLAECIVLALSEGLPSAKAKFHERIPVRLNLYFFTFIRAQLIAKRPLTILSSLRHVYRRYGIRPFLRFARDCVVDGIPAAIFSRRKAT